MMGARGRLGSFDEGFNLPAEGDPICVAGCAVRRAERGADGRRFARGARVEHEFWWKVLDLK